MAKGSKVSREQVKLLEWSPIPRHTPTLSGTPSLALTLGQRRLDRRDDRDALALPHKVSNEIRRVLAEFSPLRELREHAGDIPCGLHNARQSGRVAAEVVVCTVHHPGKAGSKAGHCELRWFAVVSSGSSSGCRTDHLHAKKTATPGTSHVASRCDSREQLPSHLRQKGRNAGHNRTRVVADQGEKQLVSVAQGTVFNGRAVRELAAMLQGDTRQQVDGLCRCRRLHLWPTTRHKALAGKLEACTDAVFRRPWVRSPHLQRTRGVRPQGSRTRAVRRRGTSPAGCRRSALTAP